MKRIKLGWKLTAKSWDVLKSNKALLWFPVISIICSFFALVLIAVPTALVALAEAGAESGNITEIALVVAAVLTAYLMTTLKLPSLK